MAGSCAKILHTNKRFGSCNEESLLTAYANKPFHQQPEAPWCVSAGRGWP